MNTLNLKWTSLIALFVCAGTGWADPLDQWVERNPNPAGAVLHGIVFWSNQFVGVGDCGTIATSPDGITWTPSPSGTTNTLRLSPLEAEVGIAKVRRYGQFTVQVGEIQGWSRHHIGPVHRVQI
jgi:hypothetical protein